jgi:hypothetical protein
MNHSRKALKSRYGFSDFLFYICLLSVPLVTAIFAIVKNSLGWAIVFIGIGAGSAATILRFYCTRCPHYARDEKLLKCIFFWGIPKFFNKRPGKLVVSDKVIAFSTAIVLMLFPLYWLLMTPGLLIVYVLSLIGFGAAIYRNECNRCIYFECPANRVPEAIKNSL